MTTRRDHKSFVAGALLLTLALTTTPILADTDEPKPNLLLVNDSESFQSPTKEETNPETQEELGTSTMGTLPKFMGGDLEKFRVWVAKHLVYPQDALDNNIQGQVIANFIVEANGKVSNIEILYSPWYSLSDEVIRVIQSSPDWTPAMDQNGDPIRLRHVIPIRFAL